MYLGIHALVAQRVRRCVDGDMTGWLQIGSMYVSVHANGWLHIACVFNDTACNGAQGLTD